MVSSMQYRETKTQEAMNREAMRGTSMNANIFFELRELWETCGRSGTADIVDRYLSSKLLCIYDGHQGDCGKAK